MADAPRDLVHQLRGVDGALSQLSGGRALEQSVLERLDAAPRPSRRPIAFAFAGVCAVAALGVLWGARASTSDAQLVQAEPAPQAAHDQRAHEGAPSPAFASSTASAALPPRDDDAPSKSASPAPTIAPDAAPAPSTLEMVAMPTAPSLAPVPRAPRRHRDVERSPRALESTRAERLDAVAALAAAEVPAALLRLKELRAAGSHRELVALADALLAHRLDARERETVSYERARALVRLGDQRACAAIERHARDFPHSADDVAPLRQRAACP